MIAKVAPVRLCIGALSKGFCPIRYVWRSPPPPLRLQRPIPRIHPHRCHPYHLYKHILINQPCAYICYLHLTLLSFYGTAGEPPPDTSGQTAQTKGRYTYNHGLPAHPLQHAVSGTKSAITGSLTHQLTACWQEVIQMPINVMIPLAASLAVPYRKECHAVMSGFLQAIYLRCFNQVWWDGFKIRRMVIWSSMQYNTESALCMC